MPDLKLARLPDRTPIKIGIVVMPELNDRLAAYAAAYAGAGGRTHPGDACRLPRQRPRLFASESTKELRNAPAFAIQAAVEHARFARE